MPPTLRRWTTPRGICAALITSAAVSACYPAPSTAAGPLSAADSAAHAAVAREAALDPATYPARTVGVAPLAVQGNDTLLAPLGYGLADLLITDLARSTQLQVVDRIRTDAMLRELRLASSGAVDTAAAPRVGKLLGARRLVVGALAPLPAGEVAVAARFADAATGTLGESISAAAPLARILDAEKALAFRLFEVMGVTLTPAERAAVEQRPTQNVGALLAYSRGVRDEALGDYARARGQYQAALQLDPGFALARSRLIDVRARSEGGSRTAGRSSLQRVVALTTEGVNRGAPPVSEAADAPVLNARQLATIVVIINNPILFPLP